MQKTFTIKKGDIICQAFERVKKECATHEQCTSKCKFYDIHGCHFRLSPEYWDCEKIKKGVMI